MAEHWHEADVIPVDIAIVGGGIAGLWLLNRLRDENYRVLLIESDSLGNGQTLCSQGIIHGGVKYSLTGKLSSATQTIAGMPQRWRRCIEGKGELDLIQAQVLSDYHYLLTTASLGSKLSGFFASKLMQSRIIPLPANEYPEPLMHPGFHGGVYRLQEPVLDIGSVLRCLADPQRDNLLHGKVVSFEPQQKRLHVQTAAGDIINIQAQQTVFSAGSANEALSSVPMQRRPLHMVLVRGAELPMLYIHCLGTGDTPKLTITSHRTEDAQTVWYIGGHLAESGVERDSATQIEYARKQLQELLNWVDYSRAEFATLRIDRAEARQATGSRPDTPGVIADQQKIVAWPTKLAMAPLLADQVLNILREQQIKPTTTETHVMEAILSRSWPRPTIGDYPWQRIRQWH